MGTASIFEQWPKGGNDTKTLIIIVCVLSYFGVAGMVAGASYYLKSKVGREHPGEDATVTGLFWPITAALTLALDYVDYKLKEEAES